MFAILSAVVSEAAPSVTAYPTATPAPRPTVGPKTSSTIPTKPMSRRPVARDTPADASAISNAATAMNPQQPTRTSLDATKPPAVDAAMKDGTIRGLFEGDRPLTPKPLRPRALRLSH